MQNLIIHSIDIFVYGKFNRVSSTIILDKTSKDTGVCKRVTSGRCNL